MLSIDIVFLTGRYHANPWGRHHNEGVAEWPPSPWRLLRAILSSWRGSAPEVPAAEVQRLLDSLSAEPPEFFLPPWDRGHTRHYVPTGTERRLHLNAFTAVDREQPVSFLWPLLQLPPQDQALLDRLLAGIGYFGRSESWAMLRQSAAQRQANCQPSGDEEGYGCFVNVLAPAPGVRCEQVMESTHTLRKRRYSRPPGSRWLAYRLPGQLEVPGDRSPATLAVYRLEREVPRAQTIVLAHRVRRALLKLGEPSPTLLGKDQKGARRDGHQHLHLLPEGRPGLDRVLLWAPEGFQPADLEMLGRLQGLPGEKAFPRLALQMYEVANVPYLGHSSVWRSGTPFLCARHPKPDGRDSLQAQVRRECALRGLPVPEIQNVQGDGLEYKLRRGRGPAPVGPPAWLRLEFPVPVLGPLCLGASCHFGLGRFLPEG